MVHPGFKDHTLHNASEAAVVGVVRESAAGYDEKGITVNGVAPGSIKTDTFTRNARRCVFGGSPD